MSQSFQVFKATFWNKAWNRQVWLVKAECAFSHNIYGRNIPYYLNQMPQLLFFGAYLSAATIWGWDVFLWKAHRHQCRLDKVQVIERQLLDAVSSPLSPAVSCGIKPYNMNSPSASLGTMVRNKCACDAYVAVPGLMRYSAELPLRVGLICAT